MFLSDLLLQVKYQTGNTFSQPFLSEVKNMSFPLDGHLCIAVVAHYQGRNNCQLFNHLHREHESAWKTQ